MPALRCGQYKSGQTFRPQKCDSLATQVTPGPYPPGAFVRSRLYCNVHAGALKRSRYRTIPELLPITDPAVAEIVAAARAEADDERQRATEERARQEVEAQRQYEARIVKEWAEYGTEYVYTLVPREPADHDVGREDEAEIEIKPVSGGRWDGHRLEVKGTDRQLPMYIRTLSTGSMTPKEARVLASALIAAAERAEAINATRKVV